MAFCNVRYELENFNYLICQNAFLGIFFDFLSSIRLYLVPNIKYKKQSHIFIGKVREIIHYFNRLNGH